MQSEASHAPLAAGPAYASLKDWAAMSGMSLSKTYEELRAGNLEGRKVGRKTLICVRAGLDWLASQPRWEPSSPVAPSRKRQAA